MQMMQAEMTFVHARGENEAKENGNRGRSINPDIICYRDGAEVHIAWTNNIEVKHAQDGEKNEEKKEEENLVMLLTCAEMSFHVLKKDFENTT